MAAEANRPSGSSGPTEPIHLRPDDYHVIGPQDFGAPGLTARESVGPFVDIAALGPLVTVHDSVFEPRSGIGHHPHRGMERLFYIVDGAIDHDDRFNDIRGTMHTGDLGILTEGDRGMVHSERNGSDGSARAYILVYPCEPMPPTASFDAVRDQEMPRLTLGDGVQTKLVLPRASGRVHGQLYEMADTRLDVGASIPVELEPDEGALFFCFDGRVQIDADGAEPVDSVGVDDTVLLPPTPGARSVRVAAQAPSRILHAVMGAGFGLRVTETNENHEDHGEEMT